MTQLPLMDGVREEGRRDEDFYETPAEQTDILLERLVLPRPALIIEPAAGNGAIARVLREAGHYVITNDVVARAFPLDFQLDATETSTWSVLATEARAVYGRPADAVITNLPFNEAHAIIAVGLGFVPVFASILRRTWDEPTEERGEWLAAHPCDFQIVMPRHSYAGNGGGDQATTAWFGWGQGVVRGGDLTPLLRPGYGALSVANRLERDRHIARRKGFTV